MSKLAIFEIDKYGEFYFSVANTKQLDAKLILGTWQAIAHLFDNWRDTESAEDPIQIKFEVIPSKNNFYPFNQMFLLNQTEEQRLESLQSIKKLLEHSIKRTAELIGLKTVIGISPLKYEDKITYECVIHFSKKDLRQAKFYNFDIKKWLAIGLAISIPATVSGAIALLAAGILLIQPVTLILSVAAMLGLCLFLSYQFLRYEENLSLNLLEIENMPKDVRKMVETFTGEELHFEYNKSRPLENCPSFFKMSLGHCSCFDTMECCCDNTLQDDTHQNNREDIGLMWRQTASFYNAV